MNTNSKHYEKLNIQPWEIMERNFTTEEFVAYLKGNIIKYTLRDKGQALTDAEKIKHYADKLIEVLEKDKESEEKPEAKYEFKVGDRVRLLNSNKTGTIIRTPIEKIWAECNISYIVELDKQYSGWQATKEKHLVDSENAWYVHGRDIVLLKDEPKKTLKPNKWYDAEDFTVEELKELLPVGTKVIVMKDYTTNNNDHNEIELTKETGLITTVQRVDKKHMTELTRVAIPDDIFFRRYFRIVGEN